MNTFLSNFHFADSLSFIFSIIVDSLHARIGLNVTLFLALTALQVSSFYSFGSLWSHFANASFVFALFSCLQFVINDQLPKSSYPTAVTEIIVVCYAVVSFGVSHPENEENS